MKKLFLLMLMFFFMNLSASAQIQRKFFDLFLGESTKTEVLKTCKSKGIELFEKEDCYYAEKVKFGGNTWPLALFFFHNNILTMVAFCDNDYDSSSESIDKTFENYCDALSEKYSDYYDNFSSNDQLKVFRDKATTLKLEMSYVETRKTVSITYIDRELQREVRNKNFDEL
jgi:hypothetical protein